MHRHMVERHNGVIGNGNGICDYKMESLNHFRESLTRVLEEAVRIQEVDSDPKILMMNSKFEYYGPQDVRPAFTKGPANFW